MTQTQEPRALDDGQIRALAAQLVDVGPAILRVVPPDTAVGILGWVSQDPQDGLLFAADTSLPLSAPGLLDFEDGELISISAPLTDLMYGDTVAETALRQDTFSAATAVLVVAYGQPSEREPGPWPAIYWQVADVTLSLYSGRTGVDLTIERTAHRDEILRLAAQERDAMDE